MPSPPTDPNRIPIPSDAVPVPDVILPSCARWQPNYPDSDHDGFADHCDLDTFDPTHKDTDNDYLPDSQDSSPNTYDRDNDGLPDGKDSQPDVNQGREEEQRQQEQQNEADEEERRQEEQRQERRQQEGEEDGGY